MPQLCRGKLDLSTFQKRSCLGTKEFHRNFLVSGYLAEKQ